MMIKMIKSKLTIITLHSFATILISCNNSNVNEKKTAIDTTEEQVDTTAIDSKTINESTTEVQTKVDSKASGFVENLKAGEKLSSFFYDSWLFVYHEDNRCDGSTDGQLNNLTKEMIDSIITLQVKNDGDGWGCDKKDPNTYNLDFDIKKKIANWDRFEIPNYENKEENIVYIVGSGESDYLKLHYNDNKLIIKLEYRSEDPG
ncbi:MAG: hypothetical protein CMO01_21410 [Thalassobius sp.]|nr:hypothetical protein [Thalassovita sp.]